MPGQLTLVVVEGKPAYLDIRLDGKKYSIRWDEKGVHVWCSQGVKLELADIGEPCRWLIIK